MLIFCGGHTRECCVHTCFSSGNSTSDGRFRSSHLWDSEQKWIWVCHLPQNADFYISEVWKQPFDVIQGFFCLLVLFVCYYAEILFWDFYIFWYFDFYLHSVTEPNLDMLMCLAERKYSFPACVSYEWFSYRWVSTSPRAVNLEAVSVQAWTLPGS